MKPADLNIIDEIHAWWTRGTGAKKYYVKYSDADDSYSIPMSFGQAVDYARIFNGEIFKV